MPADTNEVDEDIAELEKSLRDSRIIFWLCAAALFLIPTVETFFIYKAVTFGEAGRANYWTGFAVVGGYLAFGGVIFALVTGVAARETVFSERQSLLRTRETRKVLLSGSGSSRLALLNRYKNDLPELVEGFRVTARRYRQRHNLLQAVIVVGSLSASAIISAFGEGGVGRLAAASVSVAVAVAAAFSAYFRLKEKSLSLQSTADGIEQAHRAVQLGIGPYAGKSSVEALSAFAESVEAIRANQQREALELDQAVRVEYQSGPAHDLQ